MFQLKNLELLSWFSKIYTISPCSVLLIAEAVVRMCSVEKVFLEISQNSQENNCARVSFLIKLQALDYEKGFSVFED